MREAVGVGLDLDDVVQRASVSGSQDVAALPAVHVRLPHVVAARRGQPLALPSSFAGPALALAHAGACGQVRPEVYDTFGIWRRLAGEALSRARTGPLRYAVHDLVETTTDGRPARLTVAIPDPSPEEAQERWLAALAGAGRVQPVWRSVLAALGVVSRPDAPPAASFTLLAAEVGWGVLRANVLTIERDPETGLHVPERRRPGVEVTWEGAAPPAAEQRIPVGWTRRPDGCLVRATAAPAILPPEVSNEVEESAGKLATKLAERLTVDGTTPAMWLVEGALAGMPCGPARLGDAVARGLRRVLPEPAVVELATASQGLVARGGAECARRLALDLPAWWDALPQLEINRVDRRGEVTFVTLVHAPRIAGGSTYTNAVGGFALPDGARRMVFVLLHGDHRTARRLEQPLSRPLPREIPVKLLVRQKPAQGRAQVDVVPVDPTPDFPPVRLDWDLLRDTGRTREEELHELQRIVGLRFPPKTPVPAGLYHWRETSLPRTLERFLEIDAEVRSFDYREAVAACLRALRACRPPDGGRRVGVVSSDGEPHARLSPDERELLQAFRLKLDRDIRALPYGNDTRRRLVLAGAWLYAGAPAAVREDLRLALERRDYTHGAVQAAGRSLSDELNVRLFFARCAQVFRQEAGNTDWAKALGQILLYREDACLWLDAEKTRLCLYGAVRQLQRALAVRGRPRPQIFNNAILALLGLLRVRRHVPAFLLGDDGDPVPRKAGRAIREHLDQLAGRLDRVDPWRAKRVREVLHYLEGEGTDQLVAAHFDD